MASKTQIAAERAAQRRQEQLAWRAERERAAERRQALQTDPRVQAAKATAKVERLERARARGGSRSGGVAALQQAKADLARWVQLLEEESS